jgi:hypothetical protein
MDTLVKLSGGVAAKQQRLMQQQSFFTGMQRAMAGEAVADIAKEQPWYATLFGEADVTEGARAYAASAKAQEAIGALEDDMPNLRKLGPQEAQQAFLKVINGTATGDIPTDAALMTTFTQHMPALMRRQTKEHWGWKQEQAVASESEAFRAGADLLQNAGAGLAAGTTTREEYQGIIENFKMGVIPAAGRDEKGYKENMTANLAQWAAQGKFHAVNALMESGFGDVLNAEQLTKITKAQEAGESRTRSRYSMDHSDELARIKAMAEKPIEGTTTTDLANRIDALNKGYQDLTGSRLPLIGPEERSGYLSRNAVAISRERDRQYDKAYTAAMRSGQGALKAQADEDKQNVLRVAAARGDLGVVHGATRDERNKAAEEIYQQLDQAGRVKFLTQNMGTDYVVDTIKNKLNGSITAALTSGQIDQTWMTAWDGYVALRQENPSVADAYYSDHKHRLEGMYNDVQAGLTMEGSFRRWFTGPAARKNLSKEDAKTVTAAIDSEFNSYIPEWMGGNEKLKPGQNYRIMAEIGPDAERMAASTNGDIKLAVNRTIRSARQNGMEVSGGYVWQNAKGQQSLQQYLTGPNGPAPVGVDKVSSAFDGAVHWALYGGSGRQGVLGTGFLDDDANDVYVGRLPDRDGVPQFHIQATLKSGETRDAVLSGKDIYTYYGRQREARAAAKARVTAVRR